MQVSILTPIFNAEQYLAETIESVLAQQDAPAWELLLVDDGSRDGSARIARDYAAQHPNRIRLLSHPDGGNRGASASRNLAAAQARGETLAFLDADDVWLPTMLQTQWRALQRHPEVAMVYAAAERWWSFELPFSAVPQGDNALPPLLPADAQAGTLQPPTLVQWFRADESMCPCTCTVLMRKQLFDSVGGFEEQFHGLYDDQALYAKIALRYPVLVQLDCVARYRQHAGSLCNDAFHDVETTEQERRRFTDWLHRLRARLRPLAQPGRVGAPRVAAAARTRPSHLLQTSASS